MEIAHAHGFEWYTEIIARAMRHILYMQCTCTIVIKKFLQKSRESRDDETIKNKETRIETKLHVYKKYGNNNALHVKNG